MSVDIQHRYTPEAIDSEMVEIYRAMSPAQKLHITNGMWRSVREMLTRVLTAEHPEWPAGQVRRTVAERMSRGTD